MDRIYDSSKAASNPFRILWSPGDTLTYLDIQMIVTGIVDGCDFKDAEGIDMGYKLLPSLTVEYLNSRDEIQTKIFYEHHIPALKVFNK